MASESITPTEVLFSLSGSRENIDADKARAFVHSFPSSEATKIQLSNKSFNIEAATIIGEKIKTLTGVTVADISDIIAGKAEEEAVQVLKCFSDSMSGFPLTEVNVSENALGPRGIQACETILTLKTLNTLHFCNNGISAEACAQIESLLLGRGTPPPIVSFQYHNNMSGDGGGESVSRIISQCPLLKDIRFSSCRSKNKGCKAFVQSLLIFDELEKILFSDVSAGLEAAEILASVIRKQKRLRYLNLRDAGLTEEGVKAVLDALRDTELPLEYLDLSGNDITSDLAESIASMLSSQKQLVDLYLDDNEIGSAGLVVISAAIPNLTRLRIFSACTCEITSIGAHKVAQAISKLRRFSQLSLNGNTILPECVEAISNLLEANGQTLGDMDDNDEDDEEGEEYLESIEAGEGAESVDSDVDAN
jgi:Ran GTPase-activating protein 1